MFSFGFSVFSTIILAVSLWQTVELKQGLGTLGGQNDLRDSDRNSKRVQDVALFATNEIHQQKLRNGEYNKCTSLGYEVKKETYQGAGIKYKLDMKIFPMAVQSVECAADKQRSTRKNKWMPELCEVIVQVQPWKEAKKRLLKSICLKIED